MAKVTYRIHSGGDGWIVAENGADGASYVTREAAFEVATAAAMNVLKHGDGVAIEIEPAAADAPALGPE